MHIKFKIPKQIDIPYEQSFVNGLLDQIRSLGEQRKVKLPNKIQVGGMYGNYAYICYGTKELKQIILQVINNMQLKVIQ